MRVGANAVVCVVALLGAAAVVEAKQRKLLTTKVDWIDSAEQTGTMLFQGEVVDGVLTGRAYPGGGVELVVEGTVDANGAVEGTLSTTEAAPLGDFSGEMNAQQELEGALVIDSEVDCEWVAPAEELPAP
jgi:hypothetical protein